MFNKKIPIIYLTKDKLKAVLVKTGKAPAIIKSDEITWSKDSLDKAFVQVKKQLKTKSIRILLSDELSYVLSLNIPFNTKVKDERKLIEEKIKPEIPEILENENWDFKETGRKTQSDKQIIAFAPVKSIFTLISQALVDANLKLQAIEPKTISKIRNPNPVIGLALKKDLKGRDEKVLNLSLKKLSPTKLKPSKSQSSELPAVRNEVKDSSEPKKLKPKPNKTLIIAFIVTLTLGALITGGILVQRNALQNNLKPSPSPLIVASPNPTPSPSPSPSPEPEIEVTLSDYKILVLNGTGGRGVAGTVKDILEAKDFVEIIADNADELDHQKTSVQLKTNTPETVWTIIERSLNSDYDLIKNQTPLTDDNEYDVIITVGKLQKQ
ncbi:MAG: LytR C-terminal domain-containing protein [Patescibacteria group bacterium]|nr:LytR C-terminal domain-containing protein [Patescibacteria group bacterium]